MENWLPGVSGGDRVRLYWGSSKECLGGDGTILYLDYVDSYMTPHVFVKIHRTLQLEWILLFITLNLKKNNEDIFEE